MGRRVTDDEILEALRDAATRAPSPMTTVDYLAHRSPEHPSASTAGNRFCGWDKALEAAGLPSHHRPWRKWTRDEAVEAIRVWLETASDTRFKAYEADVHANQGLPRQWHLVRLFGGWKQAITAARAADES